MKKSLGKKLTLSMVTVADLSNKELSNLKGGQYSFWCGTGDYCTYTCYVKCPNSEGTREDCITNTCSMDTECVCL